MIRRIINSSVVSFSFVLRTDSFYRNAQLQRQGNNSFDFLILVVRLTNSSWIFFFFLTQLLSKSWPNPQVPWSVLSGHHWEVVFAGAEEEGKRKKVGILRPRDSKVLSVLGRGVTAFFPGRPTSRHPPLSAYWRGCPITWPTCLREIPSSVPWHPRYTGSRHAAGGWRQSCPDTSRAGTGKGGGVSPRAYPLPTTHVPRHNQSEFLEKPIRETSHLRYVCESHTKVPGHALQSERSGSISPQQPPTLSVRFAWLHCACGTSS